MPWDARVGHGTGQYFGHLSAVDPAPDMNREALARVCVDQVEYAHDPSIVCEGAEEIT